MEPSQPHEGGDGDGTNARKILNRYTHFTVVVASTFILVAEQEHSWAFILCLIEFLKRMALTLRSAYVKVAVTGTLAGASGQALNKFLQKRQSRKGQQESQQILTVRSDLQEDFYNN